LQASFPAVRRHNPGQDQAAGQEIAVEDNPLVGFVVESESGFEFRLTPAGLFGEELGFDRQAQPVHGLAFVRERFC